MSENYIDNNEKQITKTLDQVSAMGNLFSKEEDSEEQESSKNASRSGGPPPFTIQPGNDLLMRHQKHFFKFFDRVGIGKLLQGFDETQVIESEKVILNAFLSEVRTPKPVAQKNWSALQHYIFYIYRHVLSPQPCNSNEILHNVITKKIRDIIDSLIQEDFMQLCLRLVMLVREYAIVASGYFDLLKFPKMTPYLVSLMSYYSAFCSAASKLAPLLTEFDFLIMDRFNVNWLCLNKSIFYHYFYMGPGVQDKIPEFHKLREEDTHNYKNLIETYACFTEDMTLLSARWATLKLRISSLIQKRAMSDPEKHLLEDWKMFEEQKKVLKSNYWIIRSAEALQLQDMTELDAHVLSVVGDISYIADLLMDSYGHCLCEDCLLAEFRASSVTAPIIPSPFQGLPPGSCRLITCYICHDPVALDAFVNHVVTKHHDTPTQKPTRVYLTPHQKRLFCPKKSLKHTDGVKVRETYPFECLFDKNIDLKESILKFVQGRAMRTGPLLNDKQNSSSKIAELKDSEELKHKIPRVNEVKSLTNPVSPIFQTPGEAAVKCVKEPILKVASKAPAMQNGNEVLKSASKPEIVLTCPFDNYIKKHGNEAQISKSSLSENMKWKSTDVANKKATEILKRTSELFTNKDVPRNVGEKVLPNETVPKKTLSVSNTINLSTSDLNTTFRKPQHKSTVDPKMLEFFKNSNTPKSSNSTTKSDNTCLGHACGHKCKQEEQADAKKHPCQEGSEHHKESRKCECAYCEVFGTNILPHAHKMNETRDRLRTRLNQRKEKIPESTTQATRLLLSQSNSTNSKSSDVGGKSNSNNTNSGTKSKLVNEPDRVPPRVPEVHPTSPLNTKLTTTTEVKRSVATSTSSNEKVANSLSADLDRIVSDLSKWSLSSSSSTSLDSIPVDSRDIDELLKFIEGTKTAEKALADKKSAKKARQRLKKAKERERLEKEKQLKEAKLKEEKLKEEERLKAIALAKQLAEKQKKLKKDKVQVEPKPKQAEIKKSSKRKIKTNSFNENSSKQNDKSSSKQYDKSLSKQNDKTSSKQNDKTLLKQSVKNLPKQNDKNSQLMEETIPAMVTIKRVAEGNNSQATVTITLKGSTPESDKLLLTLVDGHNKERVATALIGTDKRVCKTKTEPSLKIQSQQLVTDNNKRQNNDNPKNDKKKIRESNNVIPSKENKINPKQVKVTIAVDKNSSTKKEFANKKNIKVNETFKPIESNKNVKVIKDSSLQSRQATPISKDSKDDINLPMLRLPPGITITKIEGPPTNRNYKVSNMNNVNMLSHNNSHQVSNVPVSKSGVIVVDTEKLIQQSITANNNKQNRKKNKKKQREQKNNFEANEVFASNKGIGQASMVTLKNPIFHSIQSTLNVKPSTERADLSVFPNSNQQASIFKNENGMVTIRSPRLQNSFENGSSLSNFMTDLKPMFGPEISAPYVPLCNSSLSDSSKNKSFNAQEILSGLPGIEITKVDKNSVFKTDLENKKASQPAEVSIIPTTNHVINADRFNLDRDDWPFENVFNPRDVLEDDMDAEERELEAFKRFCQQSIPPERKEKVAHLNVNDIILTKKKDVTYS